MLETFGISILTSSIFILIIVFLRAVFRGKINMRLQYALWLLVVIKLLLPIPMIESPISIFNLIDSNLLQKTQALVSDEREGQFADLAEITFSEETTQNTTGITTGKPETVKAESGIGASEVFAIIAVCGSVLMLLYFISYNLRFTRFLHKRRMSFAGYDAPMPVYLVEGLPSPCLYGKAIYITPEITTDEKKLYHVITHEYCHYRQGDLLWSALRSLCLICYWWNPLVWLAAYLSKQDCELACDETALGVLGEEERIPYGKTLIGLITVKTTARDYFSIATTMTGGDRSMKQRIKRIATRQKAIISVCVVLVLLVVLCFVSISTTKEASVSDADNIDGNQPIVFDSTQIENDYFTMNIPETMVNHVAYTIKPEYDEQMQIRRLLVQFYTDSFADGEQGMLGGLSEISISDYDIYGMMDEQDLEGVDIESIWEQYVEQYGLGGEVKLVDVNTDKTGAYVYWYPTDVQWSAEKEEWYFSMKQELDTAVNSFHARQMFAEVQDEPATGESTPAAQAEELTMEMLIAMFKDGSLDTPDYFSFANAEVADIEEARNNGWLNYYVNFYLSYNGETYRLGASHSVADHTLEDMYLTRESDMDGRLIYTTEEGRNVVKDIEEFLNHKKTLADMLTIELPEGYTLSDYKANIGLAGGVLIGPQAYSIREELDEDSYGAIPEWMYSGTISGMNYSEDIFIFEDGKLVETMQFWNHTAEEKVEVLEGLDMPAVLYRVNHDLYTAAEMGILMEQGIELTPKEATSDYWYIFFASQEREQAYYLSLDSRQFSKEQAIEIAKTVKFAKEE